MSANFTKVAANADISGGHPYETSFDPTIVHGVQLQFDPKASASPICVLSNGNGVEVEIHPSGKRARPGHFSGHVHGDAAFTKLVITTLRDKPAHLNELKLVGKRA